MVLHLNSWLCGFTGYLSGCDVPPGSEVEIHSFGGSYDIIASFEIFGVILGPQFLE